MKPQTWFQKNQEGNTVAKPIWRRQPGGSMLCVGMGDSFSLLSSPLKKPCLESLYIAA
jgi:hypothetical protein